MPEWVWIIIAIIILVVIGLATFFIIRSERNRHGTPPSPSVPSPFVPPTPISPTPISPTPISPANPISTCPPYISISGYDIPSTPANNFDFTPSVPATSDPACQTICTSDECQFYTYVPSTQRCYPKKGIKKSTTNIGFKVPGTPSGSNCPAYIQYAGYDIPSDDYNGTIFDLTQTGIPAATEPDCQDECTGNSNCMFYSYDTSQNVCWPKKALTFTTGNIGFPTNPSI